jgi:hypothetical protein
MTDLIINTVHLIHPNKQSHYWYGGSVVKIVYKNYTFSIEAIGDVYVEYKNDRCKDKHNLGYCFAFFSEHFNNDTELHDAIKNDTLQITNNNWWEVIVKDPQGNVHDLMHVLDSFLINDAVEEVIKIKDVLISYIENKGDTHA